MNPDSCHQTSLPNEPPHVGIELTDERRYRYKLILGHWLYMEAIAPNYANQILVSDYCRWNPNAQYPQKDRDKAHRMLMEISFIRDTEIAHPYRAKESHAILLGLLDDTDYFGTLHNETRLNLEPDSSSYVDSQNDQQSYRETVGVRSGKNRDKQVCLCCIQVIDGQISKKGIQIADIALLFADKDGKSIPNVFENAKETRDEICERLLQRVEEYEEWQREQRRCGFVPNEQRICISLELIEDLQKIFLACLHTPATAKMSMAYGKLQNGKMLVNSFYLEPCRRLLAAVSNPENRYVRIGQALIKALEETTSDKWTTDDDLAGLKDRGFDVLAEPKRLFEITSPRCFNYGRWPTNAQYHLTYAQQIAVSRACSVSLSDPIVAVNGPPGTGKTTLLKDLFADIVVKRAERMVELDRPTAGIVRSIVAGVQISQIRRDLVDDFAIVVTSNNNSAVENITKELPYDFSYVLSDEAGNDENASVLARNQYFPELAERLFGVRKDGKKPWGFCSAPLGKTENVNKVFKALFGSDEAGADSFIESPLVCALNRLTESIPDMNAAWRHEVSRFLQLKKEVRDKLEELHRQFVDDAYITVCKEVEVPDESRGLSSWVKSFYSQLRRAIRLPVVPKKKIIKVRHLDESRILDLSGSQNTNHLKTFGDGDLGLALDRARTELFLSALQLHKLFLAANRTDIAKILYDAVNPREKTQIITSTVVRNGVPNQTPPKVRKYREGLIVGQPDALLDFSLLCPVVSFSLASLSVKYGKNGVGTIPWVVVDEAGQATLPSSVVPLDKARRIIVVGDPRQVPPVVTVPKSLAVKVQPKPRTWNDHQNDLAFWNPLRTSMQELADRTQKYGSWIDGTWTGLPLRAHRRCCNPMFDISDRISYDRQMVLPSSAVQKTKELRIRSRWVNVPSDDCHPSNFVPEEWDMFAKVIAAIDKELAVRREKKSFFVCTPFCDVANEFRNRLKDCSLFYLQVQNASKQVGTIHTVQGREADIVFFVLGGGSGGSRAWAANSKNLINVAVTRAKESIFIFGDRKRWSIGNFLKVQAFFDSESGIAKCQLTEKEMKDNP